jgi:peptidoglycan/LPS O-acetylase OafA/YrhL
VTASAPLDGGTAARTERAFPSLDGLRAVAATAVLVHHVGFWTASYTPDLLGRVLARLDVGVPIFFVLSGFLLSRPWFEAAAAGVRSPRSTAYLWRRALRILPMYWLTVAAGLLLLPGNAHAGLGDWLRHLTLTQIYGAGPLAEGLTHLWSLCTEVAFYLVLPLAAPGLVRLSRRRPHRPGGLLVALGVATLLGLGWVAAGHSSGLALDMWLPAFTGWFGAGMALAVLSVSDPGWGPVRVGRELASSLPTCWAAAVVLLWVATSPVAGPYGLDTPSPVQALIKNVLYLGVAAFLVLPLVLGDQGAGWARRLLASRPSRYLGEISYGLFLVHVVVLTGGYAALGWLPFTGDLVPVLLAVWLVSVALSALLHAAVERPLRRWRSLVPARPRGPGGSTSQADATAATATSASA